MNKEMIEKLKDKDIAQAFGLLELREQEVMFKVGWKNRIVLTANGWRDDSDKIANRERSHLTFAIKPDYQPEPEFVDLEIVRDCRDSTDSWLGVWRKGHQFLPHAFTHLHCLPSLPNFNKFWFTDDLTGKECKVLYSDVSNARDQGNKVFTRFRT